MSKTPCPPSESAMIDQVQVHCTGNVFMVQVLCLWYRYCVFGTCSDAGTLYHHQKPVKDPLSPGESATCDHPVTHVLQAVQNIHLLKSFEP